MAKKIYNKLIRDKIPEIIERNGGVSKVSVLNEDEFGAALKNKLVEETQEVLEANSKEDVLNELSDVLELVETIARDNNFTMSEVENKKQNKKEERGGFEKRLFLEYIEE
ncbi:nucleoside triphosphate pyrophosphohydrolase [Candidatus Parcubacteria bacterium]|nr:nucleoside triphosphate pyrophosphohydrolase [Candidatus Parcubacteria bacterium]